MHSRSIRRQMAIGASRDVVISVGTQHRHSTPTTPTIDRKQQRTEVCIPQLDEQESDICSSDDDLSDESSLFDDWFNEELEQDQEQQQQSSTTEEYINNIKNQYYDYFSGIFNNINQQPHIQLREPKGSCRWSNAFYESATVVEESLLFMVTWSSTRMKDSPVDSLLALLHHIFPGCRLPKHIKVIRELLRKDFGQESIIKIDYCATCQKTIFTPDSTNCKYCITNRNGKIISKQEKNHTIM